ncbi:hypothetical protein [Pelagibius sp.]|uniref:hypothetical protein n=1 Tax=Pelagibius sp. TaxID=1931238 RepID=UPI002621B8F8|nr:hypothetical protein [Pelagibius sp.]
MIRLALPREPYWLDLPHGVRVNVQPLDTALEAAARARAAGLLRERIDPAGPADDPRRIGWAKQALAAALAELAILEWDGVLEADGNVALVSPATTARLMAIPEMASAFLRDLYAPLDRLVAEGNASSAAPHGTSAAAPRIAAAAGPAAAPAAATVAQP